MANEDPAENADLDKDCEDFSLKPHATIKTPPTDKPFLLIVLDGWGESIDADDNAVSQAHTPTLDALKQVLCLLSLVIRFCTL